MADLWVLAWIAAVVFVLGSASVPFLRTRAAVAAAVAIPPLTLVGFVVGLKTGLL